MNNYRQMKHFITLFISALVCVCAHAQTRYVGGDISTLPLYEKDLSYYKDVNGSKITNFITWAINDCGWNTFRVRIFVNPTKADQDGSLNPSVCQDLAFCDGVRPTNQSRRSVFHARFSLLGHLGRCDAHPGSCGLERTIQRTDGG